MSKKQLIVFEVLSNQFLNDTYFCLKLQSKENLPTISAGQFVEIKIENTPSVFLRRPISIYNVDAVENTISLLIQKVGDGTAWLSERHQGDKIDILLPLGNGFPLEKAQKTALLIGGGVGIAPLLYLGRKLAENKVDVHYLLGFRSQKEMISLDEYQQYGSLAITTEDGSVGEKGFVTNHSILNSAQFDVIYTCGPTPMMKAVASVASAKNVACFASLENKMACGLGACLCCVTETKDGHNRCVCTEGPVFDINDIKW